MNKNTNLSILLSGIIKENPVLVLLLGMCPTLGTTSSALTAFSMGLATAFVITASNVVVSMIRNFIPDKVRIPAYIIVIATFVCVVELEMQAYFPALFKTLGIFIPLIVANCIVLGRVEVFASKNPVFKSLIDGLGTGIGFTLALTLIGIVRELLGTGKLFGKIIYTENYGMLLFVLAPGAFIVLGYIIAIFNKFKKV